MKRGGRAVELQAEGEKLAKELLNVKPGQELSVDLSRRPRFTIS